MDEPEDWRRPLKLVDLHVTHPGVDEYTSGVFCGAASVCLSQYHQPPTDLDVHVNDSRETYQLEWSLPTQTMRRAHGNRYDAIRDGAYGIVIVCVERTRSLVAIGRAEQGSGADYYVAPPGRGLDSSGWPDLEDPSIRRLEVSGQDRGSVSGRAREKRSQVRSGASAIPGMAGVVGFQRASVLIEDASD